MGKNELFLASQKKVTPSIDLAYLGACNFLGDLWWGDTMPGDTERGSLNPFDGACNP